MFVIIPELNKKKYWDAVYSAQNKHFQTAPINPPKLWVRCAFFFCLDRKYPICLAVLTLRITPLSSATLWCEWELHYGGRNVLVSMVGSKRYCAYNYYYNYKL